MKSIQPKRNGYLNEINKTVGAKHFLPQNHRQYRGERCFAPTIAPTISSILRRDRLYACPQT